MIGKTTFILTDRDTGKVVEKREEHNMVTNALRDMLNFPKIGVVCGNFGNCLSSFLPFNKYLLSGLALFGESIPEKTDDYIMNGRYDIIATAGDAYTGTDIKRGSLNVAQSGEIENGYRFVWDFTPEKAIGTIKCASLSSLYTGNMGGTFSTGSVLVNTYDFSNNSTKLFGVIGSPSGTYAMNNKDCHYYYSYSTNANQNFTIQKHRMLDPEAIGIRSSHTAVLESARSGLALPFTVNKTFANSQDKKIYLFYSYYSASVSSKVMVKIGEIDVETGESRLVLEKDFETPIAGSSANATNCMYAVFNGLLYIKFDTTVYVMSLNGELIREIPVLISTAIQFCVKDGKLIIIGRYSPTNTPCYAVLDDEARYLPNITAFENYVLHENPLVHYPYIAASSGAALFIMMRTDYLATINNLSEPLEKTDQHALQVRYEITEE